MAARRPLSRAPTQDSTTSYAALQGAATAFARPVAHGTAAAPGKTPSGSKTGARAATTTAGNATSNNKLPPSTPGASGQNSGSSPSSRQPLASEESGRGGRSINGARDAAALNTNNTSTLRLPPQPNRAHSKSPSQQAASLAAARASPGIMSSRQPDNAPDNAHLRVSASRNPAIPPKPRRLSSYTAKVMNTPGQFPMTPTENDVSSIPPTTSLVDLYERKASISPRPGKKADADADPIVVQPSRDLPLKSPKPVRTSGGITSMFQMEVENGKSEPKTAGNNNGAQEPSAPRTERPRSSLEARAAPGGQTAPPTSHAPTLARKRSSVPDATTADLEPTKAIPTAPRGRPGNSATLSPLHNSISEPVPIQRPIKATTLPPDSPTKSLPTRTTTNNSLHPYSTYSSAMTSHDLANAMVAGHLASSRHSSPGRKDTHPPPPLPNRRRNLSLSRTPSPSKAAPHPHLKKTLRPNEDDDDDEDDDHGAVRYVKRKGQKHLKKHPNKHHEGDRKRWREVVTERERKRYEGLWAVNKGLYYSFTPEEQKVLAKDPRSAEAADIYDAVYEQVSDVVVREIWARSHLPDVVLESVWDLVDGGGTGGAGEARRLKKEEFVVGMWLIDGRLKGKKLPVRVSDSVWTSVKGMQGVRIKG